MAEGKFQLIDTASDFAYEFQFFPENIRTTSRANWNPQDTTIGTKPLFYANTEPMKISVQDLYLDNTDTNVDLKPDIDLLRLQKTELEEGGPPPVLLAIWGDNKIRCVLEDLTVEEVFFSPEGKCLRAKVAIELLEHQGDGESVGVNVV